MPKLKYYDQALGQWVPVGGDDNVFVAIVDTTSAQSIYEAASAGKIVVAIGETTAHRFQYNLVSASQSGASTYKAVFVEQTYDLNDGLQSDSITIYTVTGTTWTKTTAKNGGVFVATYNSTSAADIIEAVNDGKEVICFYSGYVYRCVHTFNYMQSYTAYFACTSTSASPVSAGIHALEVSGTTWTSYTYELERTGNKVTTISASSTDVQYPSAKAVYQAILGADKVFVATYGTTTYGQIKAAIDDGKVVMLKETVSGPVGNTVSVYELASCQTMLIAFVQPALSGSSAITVATVSNTTNIWSKSTYTYENTENKTTSISSSSTNAQYPSAKAVYDAIQTSTPTDVVKYTAQTLTEDQKAQARENILNHDDLAQIVTIDNQSETLGEIKSRLDSVNSDREHVFFDVAALGASMYLCTIYIDDEEYKIFDLVSGRFTEGAYDETKLLTMCLVAAESVATQSQIDHLQEEIDELGGIEKIKDWNQLGSLIESGTSTQYISAGDKIDVNWIKTVTGSTVHGLTVTCTDRWQFAKGVGEAEAKDYYFVYDGSSWTYNEVAINLTDFALTVSGTPVTGEIMIISTAVDVVSNTFVAYDDFTPVSNSVPHNWCLEETYAPTTKAYDARESLFNLAAGKTLPMGKYKLTTPYYGSSPIITVYLETAKAYTAVDKILQFRGQSNQNVACIPGSETKYYITTAVKPAYKGENAYMDSASITILYNQEGDDWVDISTVDGITIASCQIQAALGNNCPAHCNLRQWLNDESASGHYEATTDFDVPSAYNFTQGYLYGIDPRVYNLIQPCKTKFTAGYNNEGFTQGQTYENEDKVFLLSMKEMSFNIQTAEGEATDLYSEYTGGALTNDAVAARAKYNKAGGTLNSYRWSRSAYSSGAHNSRVVSSSGTYDRSSAFVAFYLAPAYIIGKESENL